MASATQKSRYTSRTAVNGNLAYDLDWAVRERELRHAGEAPRHPESVRQERAKVHRKARALVREPQKVSAFAVLGTAAALAMAALVVLCHVRLTVLSAETVELKNQLEVLETEQVRLTAEYERTFDLATVKAAAEAAGMVKPSASQIFYIDLSGEDSAEIYQAEEPGLLERALASLNHGVYAAVEYFD